MLYGVRKIKIDRLLGIITILLQRDKATAPELNVGYTNRDYMVSWVLGFGDKAKVIDPIGLVNEIKEKAKKVVKYV